jgi:uncharacterized membrane protein
MTQSSEVSPTSRLDAAEMGALAHLWRGEVYRSTVWRVRFDNTTNWAVVTTGIAISASFSSSVASPLPLALVGLLVLFFLLLEARRYRYFNIWRLRARVLETDFYVPMLRGEDALIAVGWKRRLADDYSNPHHRISYARAVGLRLRYNYAWIFTIQALAYYGKLAIHPTAMTSVVELWQRAAVGPVPGQIVVLAGVFFHGSWLLFAAVTLYQERRSRTHVHDRLESS